MADRTFTIYCHTNAVDGKRYVGLTRQTMEARWARHVRDAKRGSPYHFHRAISKYGPSVFTHEVIATFREEAAAIEAEKFYIRTWGTCDPSRGYNATLGGESRTHSDETKARIRETSIQRWADAAYRERVLSKMKKEASTPERMKSRSEASKRRKGEKRSTEGVANIAVAQQARFSDPNQRASIADKVRALWADPSHREKILKAQKEGRLGKAY